MSLVAIRVELPAYSHSFTVQVPLSATVWDVKQEVTKLCPGAPRAEGQRLIWRGRALQDIEKIEDIWKSDETRCVHLAVHPSAWASSPPHPPPALLQRTHIESQPAPRQYVNPTQIPPTYGLQPHGMQPQTYGSQPQTHGFQPAAPSISPLYYLMHKHNSALSVLFSGRLFTPPASAPDPELWRIVAVNIYRNKGWDWPSVFDEEYPPLGILAKALNMSNGFPYLTLVTPNATPTPIQAHALKVLSYTFHILSRSSDPSLYPPMSYISYSVGTPSDINERLQQLGLPPLRYNQIPNINPNDPNNRNPVAGGAAVELRGIPMRALMVPLIMLLFRTLLLMYFFSPSKRPLFGILLCTWIVYEAWNAMRAVLVDGNERQAQGAAPRMGAPAAGGRVPNAPGRPAPRQGRPAPGAPGLAPAQNATRNHADAVLDRLSTLNLSAEDAILDSDSNAHAPGVRHRVKTFLSLFLMTLYPASWDRRRATLRRREGRIRTEANARDIPQADGEESEARTMARAQLLARHARRPAWVREYLQRVQNAEWVDDA
ncbi:hypothetical protein A0H81_03795 [Grifola frondosa]|uniref:Ubiquitin-like domain-containing protein n=1 Tax=Grifola frondosa TaxID=5627 RepID=A0A1C7MJI7_GRIFR|nr:hypothetical protein A0H81_03795 [Grifola frondosa]